MKPPGRAPCTPSTLVLTTQVHNRGISRLMFHYLLLMLMPITHYFRETRLHGMEVFICLELKLLLLVPPTSHRSDFISGMVRVTEEGSSSN